MNLAYAMVVLWSRNSEDTPRLLHVWQDRTWRGSWVSVTRQDSSKGICVWDCYTAELWEWSFVRPVAYRVVAKWLHGVYPTVLWSCRSAELQCAPAAKAYAATVLLYTQKCMDDFTSQYSVSVLIVVNWQVFDWKNRFK